MRNKQQTNRFLQKIRSEKKMHESPWLNIWTTPQTLKICFFENKNYKNKKFSRSFKYNTQADQLFIFRRRQLLRTTSSIREDKMDSIFNKPRVIIIQVRLISCRIVLMETWSFWLTEVWPMLLCETHCLPLNIKSKYSEFPDT